MGENGCERRRGRMRGEEKNVRGEEEGEGGREERAGARGGREGGEEREGARAGREGGEGGCKGRKRGRRGWRTIHVLPAREIRDEQMY